MQTNMPDWQAMMDAAPEIETPPGEGYVYIIADSHLGDVRAPTGEFFTMLSHLPQARMVVFLGDLFKVWLAMPKFWDRHMLEIFSGFAKLREANVHIVFVVGNREFFLPKDAAGAARRGLPFDTIVHEACVLRLGNLRYGLTHGDAINWRDERHVRWRRFSRGWLFELFFAVQPGWLARNVAHRIERGMARSNLEIKVHYPLREIETFAAAVMGDLDGFFVGHFHRDEEVPVVGKKGHLRIVPDWHSRKTVLRLGEDGEILSLPFGPGGKPAK